MRLTDSPGSLERGSLLYHMCDILEGAGRGKRTKLTLTTYKLVAIPSGPSLATIILGSIRRPSIFLGATSH
jgi:hypothetical protein